MRISQKEKDIKEVLAYLETHFITPSKENIKILVEIEEAPVTDKVELKRVVGRGTFTIAKFDKLLPQYKELPSDTKEQIMIESKYASYIQKQQAQIDRMKNMINIKIPQDFNFAKVAGLSNEIIEKLQTFNPPTLFAASEISGITPAAIDILHIYIRIDQKRK